MAQASAIFSKPQAVASWFASRQTTAAFLVAGAIAPLLFVPLVLMAGRLTPGYGQISSTFSDAASQGSPHPGYITLGLVIVATCLMLAAAGLGRTMPVHQSLVRLCLIVSAIGILATAVFRDYNRASGVPRNREGLLHNAFAIIAILAIEAAILAIWFAVRNQHEWSHLTMPAAVAFVAVALSGLAFNFGPDSHDGLAERILAASAFLFLSAVCVTALGVLRGEPLGFPGFTPAPTAQPSAVTLFVEE